MWTESFKLLTVALKKLIGYVPVSLNKKSHLVQWLCDFFVHFVVQAPNLAQIFVGTIRTDSEGVPKNPTFTGEGSGNFAKLQ